MSDVPARAGGARVSSHGEVDMIGMNHCAAMVVHHRTVPNYSVVCYVVYTPHTLHLQVVHAVRDAALTIVVAEVLCVYPRFPSTVSQSRY